MHKFLGDLDAHDPLYTFLSRDVLPQSNAAIRNPRFSVYKIWSSNNSVYLYKENHTGLGYVGKFFEFESEEKSYARLIKEYNNLIWLREIGFHSYPHEVIRPFACKRELNHLLLEEYREGDSLSEIIKEAIKHHKQDRLYRKLGALAFFLATLHNKTARHTRVELQIECNYFDTLLSSLEEVRRLDAKERGEIAQLISEWSKREAMWSDCQVTVHGDATPANFIFSHGPSVIAIDLERMKLSDRVFDLGRIAGELIHFFLHEGRTKEDADKCIGHFIWSYSGFFPVQQEAFNAIMARLPFYIAMTLIRIARNSWISHDYGKRLIKQARQQLGGR